MFISPKFAAVSLSFSGTVLLSSCVNTLVNLHTHTTYCDGTASALDFVKKANEVEIDKQEFKGITNEIGNTLMI